MKNKCEACRACAEKLGNQTPLHWQPFAWGKPGEIPQHFYIFPEGMPEPNQGKAQELKVVRLCTLQNPKRREE